MNAHEFLTLAGGLILGGMILAAAFSDAARLDDPRARYSVYRARTRREQWAAWEAIAARNARRDQ